MGITGKTIPVERRDSVAAEVQQHHVMSSSLMCRRCGCVLGQETPAAHPSCSLAAPSAALLQAQPDRTQARGVPGSPSRGVPSPGAPQHEELSSPCLYSQGALRQTTAAAPALMTEETKQPRKNHNSSSQLLDLFSLSKHKHPNFPPCFIWAFLSPGFFSQFLFHPLPPLAIALSSWGTLTVPRAPLANHSTPVLQPA